MTVQPLSILGESPLMLHNLTVGDHWLRIIPDGCKEEERQTFFFSVPSQNITYTASHSNSSTDYSN